MTTHSPLLHTLKSALTIAVVASHTGTATPQQEFSQQNAEAILRTLAVEIGPRPMGSPAEQRALHFAVDKFRAYGCDTSYVLPMTVAGGRNTASGVAIGVKKGTTGRIIVIGGHIDTSGPDVPGANDDGSGTACVIELARVLCQRENQSTVMFCCWGGEEQGLQGSKHFVNTFPDIDSIALMLQIDMADGSSYLIADPDGTRESAPAWLLRSAFEIFRDELGRDDLVYQTGMATWNLASGGSFGSDHVAFIDKGIPAIDFTSDVSFPIHTPQDSWENFTSSGLKRSGDLVLKLFQRYDGGVPSRTTERYLVLEMGGQLVILPYFVLWMIVAFALLTTIVAFVRLRRNRPPTDPATRVKWSGFKLLVATFFMHSFIWSSETLLGFLKGYRFPWVNNTGGFWMLGALSGCIGLWVVLQAVRRYRLSSDAFVFARESLVLFIVLIALTSFITPELAFYPAVALLCLVAALLVRPPALKLLFFAASFFVLYKMFFFDGMMLFQRLLASNTTHKAFQNILHEIAFILVYGILSLPVVYGFAAVYRSSGVDLVWLKKFRGRGGLIGTALATLGLAGYLYARPVYDHLWYSTIRVQQRYTMGEQRDLSENMIEVKSSEPLRNVHVRRGEDDTVLTERSNYWTLALPAGTRVDWVEVTSMDGLPTMRSDTVLRLDRTIEVRSAFRPLQVETTFESNEPFEVSSPWATGGRLRDPSQRETDKRKLFSWFAFPDTLLRIPITFTMREHQTITQTINVTFDSLASPLRLYRDFTNVSYRTTVTARDSIVLAPPRRGLQPTISQRP